MDARRLADDLPDVLDYEGEFGAELVLFLPFVSWLSSAGLLRRRRIRTYHGMRCFYDDLDCLEIVEKREARRYVRPNRRLPWLPVKNEHRFGARSPFHLYPDLRRKFRSVPIPARIEAGLPARPLLIVHNKHAREWRRRPYNSIPLAALEAIFEATVDAFTVVYIRHEMDAPEAGFSHDHNEPLDVDDRAVLSRHDRVLRFDDLFAAHRAAGGSQDLNTFKNALYSRCYHFISSQGGGAHHIACFSGSLLIVLHRAGKERWRAYADGYYGFLSTPPPVRVICRTEDDLRRVLPLLSRPRIDDGVARVGAAHADLLQRLSPRRQRQRWPWPRVV